MTGKTLLSRSESDPAIVVKVRPHIRTAVPETVNLIPSQVQRSCSQPGTWITLQKTVISTISSTGVNGAILLTTRDTMRRRDI